MRENVAQFLQPEVCLLPRFYFWNTADKESIRSQLLAIPAFGGLSMAYAMLDMLFNPLSNGDLLDGLLNRCRRGRKSQQDLPPEILMPRGGKAMLDNPARV